MDKGTPVADPVSSTSHVAAAFKSVIGGVFYIKNKSRGLFANS